MQDRRSIYRIKNSEIAMKYAGRVENANKTGQPVFILTERALAIFKQGKGGDRVTRYDKGTCDAQGYVGFANLMTGRTELVPASNKNDGKIRASFLYRGKEYGVVSSEELGSNAGDVHVKARAQLGDILSDGWIAFGIFKGTDDILYQFRIRSATHQIVLFEYDNVYLAYHSSSHPQLFKRRDYHIRRSIPGDIANILMKDLCEQLPLDNETQKRCVKKPLLKSIRYENAFLNASDTEIAEQLPRIMLAAILDGDIEIIAKLSFTFPQIDLFLGDLKGKNEEEIFILAFQKIELYIPKDIIQNQVINYLHEIVLSGDIKRVNRVFHVMHKLEKIFSVFSVDKSINLFNIETGKTLLMEVAIKQKDPAILIALLRKGANPELANRFSNQTALFHAAAAGRTENVISLIQHGANPNRRNIKGKTALDYAWPYHHETIKILEEYARYSCSSKIAKLGMFARLYSAAEDGNLKCSKSISQNVL